MPEFKIRHITRYTYEDPVRDSANQIILYPSKESHQETLQQEILISGDPPVDIHTDYYGNEVGIFTYTLPHSELVIDSRVSIRTTAKTQPEDSIPTGEQWKTLAAMKTEVEFFDFLRQENFISKPEVLALIDSFSIHSMTPLQAVMRFSGYIYDNFTYRKGITTVETTVDEIWAIKSGVCQDFAHMLLVMLRLSGIPSRYTSGYVCPDKQEMRGEGATHAWVEAWIPGFGWLGIDPTNNCLANELHVRLAVGRNFSDCSPVRGTYRGMADHALEVTVSVAYEDGHTVRESNAVAQPERVYPRNSYRRHVEMMQQ